MQVTASLWLTIFALARIIGMQRICGHGEIGRHKGLKILRDFEIKKGR